MSESEDRKRIGSEKGMALVLTLMMLTLITAMVVEFAYGVYTSTTALYNWRDSQRLSFVAKSGVTLGVKTILEYRTRDLYRLYKYLGKQIPFENVSEGFAGRLIMQGEDENSKFNLNSLRTPESVEVFKRLLDNLNLNEEIADRVAQWIGAADNPRLRDTEAGAKKDFMDSTDELLLIKGIDQQTYEKLLPYVTVYSYSNNARDDKSVNVNTASIPVIMSLAGIPKESAEAIVNQREIKPFGSAGEAANIGISLPTTFFTANNPVNFRITATGEENKIKRIIECVITVEGADRAKVKYWKEM